MSCLPELLSSGEEELVAVDRGQSQASRSTETMHSPNDEAVHSARRDVADVSPQPKVDLYPVPEASPFHSHSPPTGRCYGLRRAHTSSQC